MGPAIVAGWLAGGTLWTMIPRSTRFPDKRQTPLLPNPVFITLADHGNVSEPAGRGTLRRFVLKLQDRRW